ncbi:MAG: ATP-binding protein, partial [Cyanobacteria bacterium P01_A01_bin.135]
NCPVIMFTDSGTQEVAVEAMKAGLDDYVLKSPKHRIRLNQAIRSVWEGAQIRRRAKELEFRLQFLLDELGVGVFRTTLDGQLIEASDGLLRLLGFTSVAEAQPFFEQELTLPSRDRAGNPTAGSRPQQRNAAGGDVGQNRWHREIEVPQGNANSLWLQVSEAVVRLDDRVVIDGLVSDITQQKTTAAALQSLNQTLEARVQERTERLGQLNQELEAFAFSVSHDLRSPVRQIHGFVELLLEELQSVVVSETAQHYIRQVLRLTKRSSHMIDDLLQLSRTGRSKMRYTTVDMNRLVQEVMHQIESQRRDRSVNWQIESLPPVQGDRDLLRQVWQNLIENAVKYTQRRSPAQIAICGTLGESEAVYSIRDNGIGFDIQDARADLFGVFQRLPNAQAFDGTGIGLANVQKAVSRHGGRCWAEGKLDAGAVFYFALPILGP